MTVSWRLTFQEFAWRLLLSPRRIRTEHRQNSSAEQILVHQCAVWSGLTGIFPALIGVGAKHVVSNPDQRHCRAFAATSGVESSGTVGVFRSPEAQLFPGHMHRHHELLQSLFVVGVISEDFRVGPVQVIIGCGRWKRTRENKQNLTHGFPHFKPILRHSLCSNLQKAVTLRISEPRELSSSAQVLLTWCRHSGTDWHDGKLRSLRPYWGLRESSTTV